VKALINSSLTIIHALIMVGFFVLAYFVELRWVVLVWLIVEIHLIIFDGCVVTRIQQKLGGVSADSDFIPHIAKKLFHIDLTEKQHEITGAAFLYGPVMIALIVSFTR